jgi:acyl transferase domain-containing protein
MSLPNMKPPEPIAIIGLGCRFPGGANSPSKLWELLTTERSTWSPVPASRWNEEAFFHPDPDFQGMHNHRGGHFLDQDIAAFDGSFFGLAPSECEAIDPQQRVVLEVAYEALENAGIKIANIEGSDAAVFVATFSSDYDAIQQKDINDVPKYHATGIGSAIAANRISYLFDLRGPSVSIDTGCSGSLVAVHQACQSLRTGECEMALAGGVNLMLNPDQMTTMSLIR